jgi:hypothetical protein
MACAPEPLEGRLGKRRNVCGELRGYCIFDGHVRSVASRWAQALLRKE